ncbi:Protein transport protein SecG/Sec61-beta/Sbh [Trinorchestia longiramus]|nr:Protein transport protein SecG/Sec61-beta/Sbh [Trinorchestia longiramus]
MAVSPMATNVGAGGRTVSRAPAAGRPVGSGSSTLRQRKPATSSSTAARTSASTGGMWRFYTDDSPGIKVGPLPVLVGSLVFIATVFMLHIWGKYTRS